MKMLLPLAMGLMVGSSGLAAQPNGLQVNGFTAQGAQLHHAKIMKRDDRVQAFFESDGYIDGIGQLGHRAVQLSCTAFCVGPDVVATNAHCLASRRIGARTYDASNAQFTLLVRRRGLLQVTASHDLVSTGLRIADGRRPRLSIFQGSRAGNPKFKDFANDWAFVKTKRDVCRGLELSFAAMSDTRLSRAARRRRIKMIGFHNDKRRQHWLSPDCAVRIPRLTDELLNSQSNRISAATRLIYHTCDTMAGSSGAPILVDTPAGVRVAAINAGSVRFRRWRKPTGSTPRKLVALLEMNVAVRPVFLEGLRRFRQEKLIGGRAYYMAMQAQLKRLGYYNGEIDGDVGPLTRAALLSYERARGLAPLTLPTLQILQRLETDRDVVN